MDQALHISYTFTLDDDDDDTEDDSFQKMYNMHGSERVNRQSDVDGVATGQAVSDSGGQQVPFLPAQNPRLGGDN